MSSQLDPSILAAITAEARQCFLDEDAPEYLEMLELGLQNRDRPDFTLLLRAAHSLKGGAGLAAMTSLQSLAHKFEDVLLGIQQETIAEAELAWTLVESSINEIAFVLTQARTVDDVIANPELIEALETLAASATGEKNAAEIPHSEADNDLVRTTLTVNLETTFTAIEELEADLPADLIEQFVTSFIEECVFIGETFNLPWLSETVAAIAVNLNSSSGEEILSLVKEKIVRLRSQREIYLQNPAALETVAENTGEANDDVIANILNQDLEESLSAIEELDEDTPAELIQQLLASLNDECFFMAETFDLPWLAEITSPISAFSEESALESAKAQQFARELIDRIRERRDLYLTEPAEIPAIGTDKGKEQFFDIPGSNTEELSTVMFEPPTAPERAVSKKSVVSQLRIPLEKMQGMTNNVEELILTQARLQSQQQLLNKANRRLRLLNKQFEPIRDQVQNLYDRLAIGSTDLTAKESASEALDNSFDSLELDRYTELHTSLQSFQELMLQIQETRSDLDFVNRELAEDLETSQKNLDSLYTNITESRLVPFQLLAKRFLPQIRSLNQRFDKSVNLEIIGENTPIDQVLLEQLQTPLTHLLNNAFDHGIEAKSDRLIAGKSETATISLQAKVVNNQLVITIQDDGAGIDVGKVYQRAVERGICAADKSLEQFTTAEIIDWIFEPDFSTAAKVSDISGRGMGLDIVRSEIVGLKGKLAVDTEDGSGTTFTINLPLNLSLRSLLLVRLQNRILAFPNNSILEAIPFEELDFTDEHLNAIRWHQKIIPVCSVSSLLPCPRKPLEIDRAKVGIAIESGLGLVAILVDSLIREEKLIVKPFDDTIPVPNYVAGCTVLGTGEAIPVISPEGLESLTKIAKSSGSTRSRSSTSMITVLIAEDSVATRRMLEKVLTAVGYQVLVCRDGQEALDKLAKHQETIDFIISDIEMPKVNGFELLQKVRANPILQNVPVVMATSRTGDRHRQQAMKLGATGYLGKPVQPQELIDTVASLLKKN